MAGTDSRAFVARIREFADVLGDAPRLSKVVDAEAHEGPVYVPTEDALYFTAPPRRTSPADADGWLVAIGRLALDGDRFPLGADRLSVVRAKASMANGMVLDRDGWLVICEQGTRRRPARISRFNPASGESETVVDQRDGLPLNSPNDVVVKGDGTIWFTDPSYGFLQGFRPEPRLGDGVYRHDPLAGRLGVVADRLDKPNGLAFSPDETVLYVADSGAIHGPNDYSADRPHHVVAFDVLDGRRLGNPRRFATTPAGFPDGVAVDVAGRVYVSSPGGVLVHDAEGVLIGEIRLPGAVNFTFGGAAGNILFITADTAIWAATLGTTGARPPTRSEPAQEGTFVASRREPAASFV